MVLAVEPMVNVGKHQVRMADDHWSIFSADGSLAAHFEFTIAVTADGPRILTPVARGQGRPGGRLKPPRAGTKTISSGGVKTRRPAALLLLSAFAPAAHRLCCARLPPR